MRSFVLRWLRLKERVTEAVEEQDGEDAAIKKRQAVIGFHEPIIMHDTAKSRDINKAMKHLPTPAETTNPFFRGSERQGNQEDQTEEADGDKGTLIDILPHATKVEGLIGTEIGKKMEADVEKCEEAEHAAETNEVGELEEFAKGSDGERDKQEAEGPITGKVLHEFHGIGGELAVIGARSKKAQRGKASEENEGLGPFAGEELAE